MIKKIGPFVGVHGFTSRTEVAETLTMVPQEPLRRLMAGVLMNSRTLAGQMKVLERHPQKEVVADIFPDDPRVVKVIHYATDHPRMLLAQLVEITELKGLRIDGFQLDAWPPLQDLENYLELYPDKFFALKIGHEAMEQVKSMERFKEFIDAYSPMVDAVLVDTSRAGGEPLNVSVVECLRALRGYPFDVGISGSRISDMLPLFGALVREFPNLSIDIGGYGV